MIEKLLEAYEERTSGKGSFWQKLKRENLLVKITFIVSILGWIFILIIGILGWRQAAFIIIIIYIIVMYILSIVISKMQHREWKTNLINYNENLDIIAELLKSEDFNLYEKNKIKQLILKYYRSINQHEKNIDKKGNDVKEFFYTIIIPVIAFFAGRLEKINSTNVEWMAICIVFIIVIVSGKYFFLSLKDLLKIIGWNQIEKEKYFVAKLQDLLDRDFEIENNDLIYSK